MPDRKALLLAFLTACGGESYDSAVAKWQDADDVNLWIGEHFSYDQSRASRLSADSDARPPIKTPAELYADKSGVCVDLARFAVETLRTVDPDSDPKYLMLELDPVVVDGRTFRRHWLATFSRDGQVFAFADSNRPGVISGPYSTLHDLVSDYVDVRGREVVEARWLDTFKRKKVRRKRATARTSP